MTISCPFMILTFKIQNAQNIEEEVCMVFIATTRKGKGSGKTLGISSLKTERSDWEGENRLRQSSGAPYWNCYLHTTQHGNLLLDPTYIGLLNLRTKASVARDSSSLSWAFVRCGCTLLMFCKEAFLLYLQMGFHPIQRNKGHTSWQSQHRVFHLLLTIIWETEELICMNNKKNFHPCWQLVLQEGKKTDPYKPQTL